MNDENTYSIVHEFWEEHIEKSQDDYDPYHYISDLGLNSDEMLIDFNWEDDQWEEQ